MIPPYYTQRAIPRIESIGVEVKDGNVVYSFRPHNQLLAPFVGILIVRLGQEVPTTATNASKIIFDSGDSPMTVKTFKDADLTVANFTGSGVHLLFYDAYGKKLQLIS